MQIMTRGEAAALGLNKYHTGRVCKNGHLSYRYVVSGGCKDCLHSNGATSSDPIITAAKAVYDTAMNDAKNKYDKSIAETRAIHDALMAAAKQSLIDGTDRATAALLAHKIEATHILETARGDAQRAEVTRRQQIADNSAATAVSLAAMRLSGFRVPTAGIERFVSIALKYAHSLNAALTIADIFPRRTATKPNALGGWYLLYCHPQHLDALRAIADSMIV